VVSSPRISKGPAGSCCIKQGLSETATRLGSRPPRGPWDSEFACIHCIIGRHQADKADRVHAKNKVGGGIEGAPGLVPWRGKGRHL